MTKRIISVLLIIGVLLTVCTSCSLFGECTVTYDLGQAGESIEIRVDKNSRAPEPVAPTLAGHVFLGWYSDKEFTKAFNFSIPVTDDVTVYAKYVLGNKAESGDISNLINEITLSTVKATVMLSVEKYELGGALDKLKTNVSTSTGSGAVFAEKNGHYYCLTNNHVVFSEKTYRDITLTDYQGNTYVGTFIASDPDYDLAVIRIDKKISEPLEVLPFADSDPAVGEEMIALGSPSGQLNAITLGKVLKYSVITIASADAEKSNVLFPVIWHTAPMDNGSSGGVIVNHELEIVGVNYAAASKNGEFVNGLAVPVAKVLEFLDKYGITVHKA